MLIHLIRIVCFLQVFVVSGETGCGKTTQVPQFILDQAIHSGPQF
jgi:HrpA-like RNA helicase